MTGAATGAGRRAVLGGGAAVAIGLASAAAGAASSPRLAGPVAVEERRRLLGRSMGGFACAPVPPPVIDLDFETFYTDPAFTVIDPAKQRAQLEATRPLGDFSWRVSRNSDLWLLSRPAEAAPAQCGLAWLDGWASAGAMLGRMATADAQHQRRWTLCGVALAYLKLRDAPGLDIAAKARVEQWFVRLAAGATAYYGRFPPSAYNNHFCWYALALAATAVAANDHAMFSQAVALYETLLDGIQPDGSLPLEIARKSHALGYHIFALNPLVMVAEIGHANGLDLYNARGGALHRLVRRVEEGLADPQWFAQRTGVAQDRPDATAARLSYAWAEIYYPRFPDPAQAPRIVAARPIFYNWLGGSLTDDFGSPSLT